MKVAGPIVLLAAALLVVASCADSQRLSKPAYQKRLHVISGQFEAAFLGSAASVSGEGIGPASNRAVLRRMEVAARKAAGELDKLKPPKDAEADTKTMAAGLRYAAGQVAAYWKAGHDAKALAKLGQRLDGSRITSAAEAAARDLQRKGYKLGALAPAGESAASTPLGSSQAITGVGASPAKRVPALPFALVSRAGRQPAVELQASACSTDRSGSICAFLYTGSPTGPKPDGLSVIRTGERVRFTFARPVEFAALQVRKLCAGTGLPLRTAILDGTRWRVNLPPGPYIATLTFTWNGQAGSVDESGTVGLLVSNSEHRRVLPAPRCN